MLCLVYLNVMTNSAETFIKLLRSALGNTFPCLKLSFFCGSQGWKNNSTEKINEQSLSLQALVGWLE